MFKTQSDIENFVKTACETEGLVFLGIADLNVIRDADRYRAWIAEGRHGSMAWMGQNLNIRETPSTLLPGATAAFVFGFPYFLGGEKAASNDTSKPLIAQYARLKDYHSFLREKISNIQTELATKSGTATSWRVTVDSAPILERALAFRSGSGFIGKNTCFIQPQDGSFLLLGELLTTWAFDWEQSPVGDSKHLERSKSGGCGSCRRCQVHCPTGALDQDYRIDARKCLSYWTIEHRGLIPIHYWKWLGHYIFGCDICQLVCPYNRQVAEAAHAKQLLRLHSCPDLSEMVHMDQKYYEKTFGGSPMTRAKLSGLRRNALIASVVNSDPRIFPALPQLAQDPDEVVRGTALQVPEYQAQKVKN